MPQKRIEPGAPVVVVLHSPREKCWGMLDEITAAGVFLRGLDLNSFDDWLRSVLHDEPFIGLNDLFFPLWRYANKRRDGLATRSQSCLEMTGADHNDFRISANEVLRIV